MGIVKPLEEILAVVKDLEPVQKIERLRHEIEAAGVEFDRVDLFVTLDAYVTDVAHLLLNVVLDMAVDIGALPEGREAAEDEAKIALVFLKTLAVYRAIELKEDADGVVLEEVGADSEDA